MNCRQVKKEMFGLASGPSPAVEEHLRQCAACAQQAAEFRQTMALLDEWQTPEPSPYFDARLRARLHDAPAPRSLREWLREAVSPFTVIGRKVALGLAMTLLLGVGVTLMQTRHSPPHGTTKVVNDAAERPGSAVSDLQALDKNADLYANFDLLDDVSNP